MPTPLRIALLQLTAQGLDPAASLSRGLEACREAASRGADIALFPEMWSIGYTPCANDAVARGAWVARAISLDAEFLHRFRDVARELHVAIGVTFLEKHAPRPRNSFALIDRHGKIALTYAKVHTCEFDWEGELTPGDAFHVAELDTASGPVHIGAMICYDREYPESARALMLKGAEVILVPNACSMEDWRVHELEVRALENMTGIAMANYAGPPHNGRSCAFNGMVAAPDESTLDSRVLEAGPEAGVYIAEFDLEALREYRERETLGPWYRRPETYGILASPECPTRRRRG